MKTMNLKKSPALKHERTDLASRLLMIRKAINLKGLSPERKLILRQRAKDLAKEYKKP